LQALEKGKGSQVYLTDLGRSTITENIPCPPEQIKKFMMNMGVEAVKSNIDLYHNVMTGVLGERFMQEIRTNLSKASHKITSSKNQ